MNKLFISTLILSGIISGCNPQKDGHSEKPETGSPEPLAYTIYTDKTETFVEFNPLIVGKTSKFAAHFTLLGEKFRPLTDGKVTVSLIVGEKGIRNSADKASSPGIYRLALEPKVSGVGKLIFDITTPGFTDRVVIENVKVHSDEMRAKKDASAESGGEEITYLKEQAWKIDFANLEMKKQNFHEVIKTSGQILGAPGDEMVISAKSSGIVFYSGNNSIAGSAISKGESVFVISGSGLTEDNIDTKFKEAKSNYEKAKADMERANDLIKDRIISQKEYLEIKNHFETSQALFNSLSRNFTGDGTRISSPITGYLKNIYVTEGQFVQIGDPLASISQNKKIVLKADVSQKYFSKLTTLQSANFITADHKTYNTADLNGKLLAFGKSTNDHNVYIPVTFEIDNRGEILPGSYVEIYLKLNSFSDALVVPVSSLMEEQGMYFVYVQTGGESFVKREIKIGESDGLHVLVISGLSEGERVVTKGAYNIKLSAASGALPAHGHEH